MLLHLKSSIPQGFCMLNRHLSLYISKKALVRIIFCIWTRYASAQSFLEKISLHVSLSQTVSTKPLFMERGRGTKLG